MSYDKKFYETYILESVLKLVKDLLYDTFLHWFHKSIYYMTTYVISYIYIAFV